MILQPPPKVNKPKRLNSASRTRSSFPVFVKDHLIDLSLSAIIAYFSDKNNLPGRSMATCRANRAFVN
jgi:hypothetical protein